MKRRPSLVFELVVVVLLLVVFDWVAGLAKLRAKAAYANGFDMLHLTPFDLELRADHWFAHMHLLQAPASLYYDLAHINVTLVCLLATWWWQPVAYRRARTALVIVNVIGLIVFYLYPVAPPRLLPGAGFVDIVAHSGTWGASPDSPTHANAFGSMPSLHMAWAVWVAVTVMSATSKTWLRVLGWLHVVITVLVVIFTGNHYVVDLVAGAVTLAISWVLAPRVLTASSQVMRRV